MKQPPIQHGVVAVVRQADRFLVIRRSQQVRAPGQPAGDSRAFHRPPRIAVSAAGILVEVTLAAGALMLRWITVPGVVNAILLNLVFVCSVNTLLLNGNAPSAVGGIAGRQYLAVRLPLRQSVVGRF